MIMIGIDVGDELIIELLLAFAIRKKPKEYINTLWTPTWAILLI